MEANKLEPVVLFMCSRGNDDGPRCTCGNRSTDLCGAELRGSKAWLACFKPLCRRCAERVGSTSFCSAHARIASAR